MRSDELLNSVNSPSDYEETCEHTSESKRQQRIEADLLNLTLNSPTKGSRSSQRQPDNLEEALLSDFGVTSSNNSFDLLNDIMSASASNNMSPGNGGPSIGVRSENGAGTSSVDLLEELFAGPNSTPKPDLLNQRPQQTDSMSSTIGATNSIPVPRNASTPNLLGFDPFDQLPSMATSFKQASNDLLKPQKANVSSASGAGFKTDGAANGPTMPRVSSLNAFGSSTASSSAAIHSSFKPDYNRSYFTDSKGGSNGTGLSSKVPNNAFDDLLKGFTKSPTDWNASQQSNQPKSMAQLRKEEMLRNGSVDPLKMKVNEWKEGKKRNIRALLSTLHQIVWDDCSWIAVGMHQLIGPNDVKKMYRKACLSIHPDKLVGSPNEELAKLLFIELNDAWNEFEKQRN